MTLKEIDQKSKDQKKVMKKDPKFFLQARNAKKMKLNKWWKNLMKKYPFMGYGDHNYNLSIMGKDTGIAINSPRLIKKNLIKRRIKNV